MNRKSLLVTSAIAAVTLFHGTAFAAADEVKTLAEQPPAAQEDKDTSVSDVIVTVNKRNEAVQDVPVAVTAFTPEQRDTLGVVSIFDMTRATPSLEYSGAVDRTYIRGVGRNTNAPGTQAGVSVYIDGVYSSSSYGLDRSVILTSSLEVDSGPQGTLFGRNAIGGVIQVASAHATDEFQIRTDIKYNDHARFDGTITVGGPIGEHFKLLLGANVRDQKHGYFYNRALGVDTGGPTDEMLYIGVLDYKFGNMDGFLKVSSNHYDRKLSQFSPYGSTFTNRATKFNDTTYTNFISVTQNFNCLVQVTSLAACPANVAQALVYYDPTNWQALNPYEINQDYRTNYKSDGNWDMALQHNWHLPWFDLKYIGGYNQYIYDNKQDYDNTARGPFQVDPDGPANPATPVTIYPTIYNYYEDRKWSSHELNFSSNNEDSTVNWIGGLYYYHDDFTNDTHINAPGQTQLANVYVPFYAYGPATTTLAFTNPNLDYFNTHGRAFTSTYATFGQVDWQMSEKLSMTAGLRWNRDAVQTEEEDHYIVWVPQPTGSLTGSPYAGGGVYGNATDGTAAVGVVGTCTPPGLPVIPNCRFDPTKNKRYIDASWEGMGGIMTLAYKPNDATLIYAKYSAGYKSGGIAISGGMSRQPILNPETLNAYEFGYKYSPNRKITLNTTLFHYDYSNYQDFGSVPCNGCSTTGFQSIGFNIPKSSNTGIEVFGSWHPTTQFTVTASANYMDAKVKDGGTIALVDTLDPLATGSATVQYQGAPNKILTYTPQPCGLPIVVGVTTYQPQCITGSALKGSSPWKVWISPQYRFDFDAGSLDLIANFSARAGNVSSYSKNPIYKAPNYSSIDLRAVWTAAGGKYKVIGFMNNIQDKTGYEFVLAGRGTLPNENYIQNVFTIPRSYGIQVQAKF